MKCRTCCNPEKVLLRTVALLFLNVHRSYTVSYAVLYSHFSLQMSYLFQLLFTEFIFSLLGLQETVQFFFLLGLNMLLKLLFFVGHHFRLQQIQQQISLSPDGLQPVFHFSPKTQNSWYSHCDTHRASEQARVSGACPHPLLIPPPINAPSRTPFSVPHFLSPIVQLSRLTKSTPYDKLYP